VLESIAAVTDVAAAEPSLEDPSESSDVGLLADVEFEPPVLPSKLPLASLVSPSCLRRSSFSVLTSTLSTNPTDFPPNSTGELTSTMS
jgi:hypothetical protein